MEGQWITGPRVEIFKRFREELGGQWLVAEDLGEIDEPVHELRSQAGLLCTRVLQFAFGSDDENLHLPINCPPDSALYTATHDNDTTAGWWSTLPAPEAKRALNHLDCSSEQIVEGMIRGALDSPSRLVIIPAQDFLQLGTEARMNVPGKSLGNWSWRMQPDALTDSLATEINDWVGDRNSDQG